MTTPRGIKPLPHFGFQIGARGQAVNISGLVALCNSLFEIGSGTPTPGTGRLLMRGHDHCFIGTPLPRNAQYSFDCGEHVNRWSWTLATTGEWYRHDNNNSHTIAESSGGFHYFNSSPPNCLVYVTPRIDSQNTAISTNPCRLRAVGLANVTAGTGLDVRLYNRTTKTGGTAQSLTFGNNKQIDLQVECRGGQLNEIDVEIKSSGAGTLQLLQMVIAETRTQSQPVSSGTQVYSTATKP